MNRQVVRIQEGSRFVSTISISQSELVPGDIPLLTEWRNTSFGDIIQRRKPPDPVHSSSPIRLSVHLSRMSLSSSLHPSPHPLALYVFLSLPVFVGVPDLVAGQSVTPPPMVCQIDSQGSLSCL